MLRFLNIAALLIAVFVGVAVLQVKNAVKEKRAEIARLEAAIRNEQQALRILEAEVALLASPGLLEARSIDFLALMPLEPRQIIDSPDRIPLRPLGRDVDVGLSGSVVKVQPASDAVAQPPRGAQTQEDEAI